MTELPDFLKTDDGQELLSQASRAIINDIAPRELPLHHRTLKRFNSNPDDFNKAISAKDEALGSGLGISFDMILPVVLTILPPVLLYLRDMLIKTATEEGTKFAIKELAGHIAGNAGQKITFTPEQMAKIKVELTEVMKQESHRLNLSNLEAQRVRNAVLVRLLPDLQ